MGTKLFWGLALFFTFCSSSFGVINVITNFGVKNDGSDQTGAIKNALAAAVQRREPIYFPSGTYGVSASLITVINNGAGVRQSLNIRGDGPGLSKIVLTEDIKSPLFSFKGTFNGVAGQEKTVAHVSVEQIAISAGVYANGAMEKHFADAFDFEAAVLARFDRVEISYFRGRAIYGRMFWDSTFSDTHFIQSGYADSAGNMIPAVELAAAPFPVTSGPADFTNSNNIAFTNCRWESNVGVGLQLRQGAKKIRVVNSKFHGVLPTATPFDHVQIFESNLNVIDSTNFANGGGSGIVIRNSTGNVISSNIITSHRGYGIYLAGSGKNTFTGNSFDPISGGNALGNIHSNGNAGNVFSGNLN